MKTTKELLIEARALIADPKHWTQGAYARDEQGRNVSEHSSRAVCYCSVGALLCAVRTDACYGSGNNYVKARNYLNGAARALGSSGIMVLNDSSTHEVVLVAFDVAIKGAE